MNKIIVLVSGNGSNLQAILESCQNNVLPNCEVVAVISNKANAYALQRVTGSGIATVVLEKQVSETRKQYDARLAGYVKSYNPDLIVLAGWMRILTNVFLSQFAPGQVINLHPALPGQFPGANGIRQAWTAYTAGRITHTGLMVHEVVEEVDAGTVLETETIEILPSDTLETLTARVKSFEKGALIRAIHKKLNPVVTIQPVKFFVYHGKVREMHDIGYGVIAMEHSDRLSAFDRAICQVPGKGRLLLDISKWWFRNTSHIVPNHYIHNDSNVMIVKKCHPILLEIVVRGYITGSTKTSLWTHYVAGEREYCGHTFPNGLVKNQKLPRNVITPTTKGETDELISSSEILERGIVTESEWEYISRVSLELFEFGQCEAQKRGFILVDTKYEFGYDSNGHITLMDEVHTPDSSRYWQTSTYDAQMASGAEPDKIDKDSVRNYLKLQLKWDPYNLKSPVPEIPDDLIERVYKGYGELWTSLLGKKLPPQAEFSKYASFDSIVYDDYFGCVHSPTIVVVSGSERDSQFVSKLTSKANELGIYSKYVVGSAHKTPEKVLDYVQRYTETPGRRVVFIAVAGRSNALGGFLAANSRVPVINCPPFKDKMDMLVNIQSTLQMPSNVPAVTVLDPGNAVLAAHRILNIGVETD